MTNWKVRPRPHHLHLCIDLFYPKVGKGSWWFLHRVWATPKWRKCSWDSVAFMQLFKPAQQMDIGLNLSLCYKMSSETMGVSPTVFSCKLFDLEIRIQQELMSHTVWLTKHFCNSLKSYISTNAFFKKKP